MNTQEPGISLDIMDHPKTVNYTKYDVALFMGFDQTASLAKAENPSIITGVIEPRSAQNNSFDDVDFIVVNGIELKDFFSKYHKKSILYYAYPEVPKKLECPREKSRLVLGYHGNLIHLDAMYPRIIEAIERLNKETPVELWAMYNIKKMGLWQCPKHHKLKFPVIHCQHSNENYARYMAHVDIGLVPQFIPVRENKILRLLIGSVDNRYNERTDNYFLRFKETTNIGRHLVFAQYKIPVVSDMSPSACSFIEDCYNSFVANSSDGWYSTLKTLAEDKEMRKSMGERLYSKYKKVATIELLNQRLITHLKRLKHAY
ncbi:MAG: hypothetical protein PVF83_18865 [Anaerolineales bacterium]|jgi:hypothetical protein